MDQESLWAQGAQQWQKMWGEGWAQALQTCNPPGRRCTGAKLPEIRFSNDKLQALQQEYVQEAGKLWQQALQGARRLLGVTSVLRETAGPPTPWRPTRRRPTC
jgi:polyhydroxyalkanoate synthase